jgi:mannose-6-phosphate isomerase-like protein (cupin superfamily)
MLPPMKEATSEARVIRLDDLPHNARAHRFAGAENGDVPFSIIIVRVEPGNGPEPHRHPYPEVFLVQSGEATFRVGEASVVVPAGHIVIGPSNVPHAFTNTGTDELRMVNVHGSPEFVTEWLSDIAPE